MASSSSLGEPGQFFGSNSRPDLSLFVSVATHLCDIKNDLVHVFWHVNEVELRRN